MSAKKFRVIFAHPTLAPQTVFGNNGIICQTLLDLGYEVTALSYRREENHHMKEAIPGVPVLLMPTEKDMGRYLTEQPDQYDAVVSYLFRKVNRVLPYVKWRYGKKFVIRMDNWRYPLTPRGLNPARWAGRLLNFTLPLQMADAVIYETERTRAYAAPFTDEKKLLQLENGVWLKDYGALEEKWNAQNLKAKKTNPVILYVGRLTPSKGITYLLEAFAELSPKFPEWRLRLVGPQQEADYFALLKKRVEELKIASTVEFAGYFQNIEDVLQQEYLADIYCLPSIHEGFSQTILDAMFFRKPCVATIVGETDYILNYGQAGFLAPSKNAASLKAPLEKLMASPELRAQMSMAARARVEEKFLWEKILPPFREGLKARLENHVESSASR